MKTENIYISEDGKYVIIISDNQTIKFPLIGYGVILDVDEGFTVRPANDETSLEFNPVPKRIPLHEGKRIEIFPDPTEKYIIVGTMDIEVGISTPTSPTTGGGIIASHWDEPLVTEKQDALTNAHLTRLPIKIIYSEGEILIYELNK